MCSNSSTHLFVHTLVNLNTHMSIYSSIYVYPIAFGQPATVPSDAQAVKINYNRTLRVSGRHSNCTPRVSGRHSNRTPRVSGKDPGTILYLEPARAQKVSSEVLRTKQTLLNPDHATHSKSYAKSRNPESGGSLRIL